MRDSVRYNERDMGKWMLIEVLDFGKEKKLPLKGLDDKAIEQQVTDLVQKGA